MTELIRAQCSQIRGLEPRILHIGLGAFAKAHILTFHEDTLKQQPSDWGVVACRLNSGVRSLVSLDENNCEYVVGELSGTDVKISPVTSIVGTLHPKRDGPARVLGQIEDSQLKIITLTITEKGYCLQNGHLDLANAGIQKDLQNPECPTTAIGYLVEGLRRRRLSGAGGLTIMSCDNLPSNGELCQRAVREMADKIDQQLGAWIEETCAFPSSMVDRITPAMTDESHAIIEQESGKADINGVLCEPFRQWVIEDKFAAGRPEWDLAGAEFVTDIRPYEEMKLRLLNGAHSFLAYLGAVSGKATISDCMDDELFRAAVSRLMLDEQMPTLNMPDQVDLNGYVDALLARFSNSALRHKTTQIASDGSQKLPQRLLAPIQTHIASGRDWPLSALAVAGWMAYCKGSSESGQPLPLVDPLAEQITKIATEFEGDQFVENMIGIGAIFDKGLVSSPRFVSTLQSAYNDLNRHGVAACLANQLQGQTK